MRFLLPAASLLLVVAACAPSAPAGDASPRSLPPATMTSRAAFDFTAVSPARPVDMQIEVVVDSLGQPDLGTLRVSGNGSSEYRATVQRWIEASRFRPAQRDGRPVAGMFRTRMETRMEVRRM